MRPNLIFVEHEAQVKDVLQHSWNNNLTWAALGPGAIFELQQRKIHFIIPENYYQPQDLETLGKESRNRVEKICNTVDGLLWREIAEVKKIGITPTLFYFHALSLIMDVLVARVFQIKHLISEIHPQVVTVHSSPSYPLATYGIGFDNRESLYGRLLNLKEWDIDVNSLPEVTLPKEKIEQRVTMKKYIGRVITKSNLLYDVSMKLRHFNKNNLKRLIGHFINKKKMPTVCLYGGGYDWSKLLNHLARAEIKIRFLLIEPKRPKKNIIGEKQKAHLLKELEKNFAFRNLFIWEGIDTYPLLKERIAYLVGNNVNWVVSAYEGATKFFKRKNISALLTSVKPRAVDHAICLAAQHNNIPTLNWQHGSAGYYSHHTIEFLDLLTTDIYLAYGEGVCQFLEGKNERFQAILRPVGSISLDKLRNAREAKPLRRTLSQRLSRIRKAGKKVCLYTIANYFQNNWYAGYNPPPSDILLYQTQLILASELLKCSEVCLVLKLFLSPLYRNPPWVHYLQKGNSLIVISNECTFTDLLGYSDLIILDWPSTTLLEAVATSKPVFVVTKHLRIFPEPLRMLKCRAVCANEPEELVKSLRKFLSTGVYPAEMNDNAFLKAYGTHLDDDHSSDRALKEIIEVIRWQ